MSNMREQLLAKTASIRKTSAIQQDEVKRNDRTQTAPGLAGALVATFAMCGPSCVFAFYVGQVSERFTGASWSAIQTALVPISIGLIAASAFVVATAAVHNLVAAAVTLLTAFLSFVMRLNPLWIFAAAALMGLAGLL